MVFFGDLYTNDKPYCNDCGRDMYINKNFPTTLRHLPFGDTLTFIRFTRHQFRCPCCGKTKMQEVTFRSEHHRITKALQTYIEGLLAAG